MTICATEISSLLFTGSIICPKDSSLYSTQNFCPPTLFTVSSANEGAFLLFNVIQLDYGSFGSFKRGDKSF